MKSQTPDRRPEAADPRGAMPGSAGKVTRA